MSKYGHRTINWFEAIVNKLGGEEAAERFLRDELTVSQSSRNWEEKDGVIYFSVTSDGTTGPEWIERFEKKGVQIGDYAKSVLHSVDFRPTNGVTYNVAVLKGMLFNDSDRTTQNIRSEADKRKFTKPHAEVACLIRDKFSDEEIEAMGVTWIINMADPINDSDGDPELLGARRRGDGPWLLAYYDKPDGRWIRDYGFAFVVSQVSA